MKYFISKQRYLQTIDVVKDSTVKDLPVRASSVDIDDLLEFNKGDEGEELTNFDDGVELSDVTASYREMLGSLQDFKEQQQMLKNLNIGDDTDKVNLQLVKMQVLDMAERFDAMEQT